MDNSINSNNLLRKTDIFFISVIIFWTIIFILLVLINLLFLKKNTTEIAENFARESFRKDLLYRTWNGKINGLYGKISDYLQPNPYLKSDKKVITTTSGEQYTLINPAYMTRLVHDLEQDSLIVTGHITSLEPVRPQNAADEWETAALKQFKKGEREISSIIIDTSGKIFRYMAPLYVENSCLDCHNYQKSDLGKVRGGISISVPLSNFDDYFVSEKFKIIISFSGLWLIGVAAILLARQKVKTHFHKQYHLIDKIKENEKEYKHLFNSMISGCVILKKRGPEFIVKDINKMGELIMQGNRENMVGQSINSLCSDKENRDLINAVQMVGQTGDDLFIPELSLKKDNKTVRREFQIYKMENDDIVLIFRDITEQYKKEEQLHILQRAVDQSPSLVAITNNRGKIEYANPMFQKITEYSMKELAGKNPRVLKSGEHDKEFYTSLWNTLKDGDTWFGEFHNKTKSGQLYWEYAKITPIFDKKGNLTHYIKIGEDITEQKKIREALKKSEKRYRSLVESTPDAMVIFNEAGIEFYNHAFKMLIGLNNENTENLNIDKLLAIDHFKTEKLGPDTRRVEAKLTKMNGDIIDVEVIMMAIDLDNIKNSFYRLRDITKDKELLEALQRTIEKSKSLDGLIPICASCKKIRDEDKEDHTWVTPEHYIHERLPNVDFTHSICPDCMKKYYPEVYKMKYGKDAKSDKD